MSTRGESVMVKEIVDGMLEVIMSKQEIADWHAYDTAVTTISDLKHHLVEILSTDQCTPIRVHEILDLIRKNIHPHMDIWCVWNDVYWFVRSHNKGCSAKIADGRREISRCAHKYNHTVLKANSKWVLVFLKETRNKYNCSYYE